MGLVGVPIDARFTCCSIPERCRSRWQSLAERLPATREHMSRVPLAENERSMFFHGAPKSARIR